MTNYEFCPYTNENAAFEDIQQLHGRRSKSEPFPLPAIGGVAQVLDTVGFMHTRGFSYPTLADLFGRSLSVMKQWGRTAKHLTPEAKEAIDRYPSVSITHARAISHYPADQQVRMARKVAMNGTTVAELEEQLASEELEHGNDMQKYMDGVAEVMGEQISRPVRVIVDKDDQKAGVVSFKYHNLDEFDGICDLMGVSLQDNDY